MSIFTDSPLSTILSHAKLRTYPKGQIILYEGETPTDLYIIKDGIVKVYDIDDQGNEKILHIMKAPSVFPMVFFLGGHHETRSFYTTLTDTEMYVVSQSFVEEQMRADSELAIALMQSFARETHELLVRLSSMEKTNTRDKLIAALKFLCVYHAKELRGGWSQVTFPISHQLLADMIGVTRESTTMVMKELQEEKLVRNPRLTILEVNFAKLVHL